MNVCGAEAVLPHHVLYPVDKIISAIATIDDDGDYDMSQMPWYETLSGGYVYYFRQSHCGYTEMFQTRMRKMSVR